MTDIAIRVENLSKLYHLGRAQSRAGDSLRSQRHDTLRDAIMDPLTRIARRKKDNSSNSRNSCQKPGDNSSNSTEGSCQKPEDLWALKDVSFDVKQGEVVGIIGRNGAGKSTLLKILSRITEPTSGRAEIHGRVASLLEVGTGFHPELTGRENIYLNGAILGMHRAEIERKFDEIVAFAEIERFLDTPVKRYSSGMYVRLAFAVAAHLEPEILLVDEVLAVGDAQFQEKCLGKMGEVAREGRTVFFVSHNMAAVRHLCTRALTFVDGQVSFDGSPDAAVERYFTPADFHLSLLPSALRFENPMVEPGQRFEVLAVEILDDLGRLKSELATGEYARFRITWRAAEPVERGGVELGIHTLEGVPVIQYSSRPVATVNVVFLVGLNTIECEFQQLPLAAGQYHISVALTRPMIEWLYKNDHFARLTIKEQDVFRSGVPIHSSRSILVIPHKWVTSPLH